MKEEFNTGVPWIGVDFDGTLAHYDGWKSPYDFGAPIEPMVQLVRNIINGGVIINGETIHYVKIFTARMSETSLAKRLKIQTAIGDWTRLHIGKRLPATAVKDFDCVEIWDDRARRVLKNRGIFADTADRR